jgi:hypothetical protein
MIVHPPSVVMAMYRFVVGDRFVALDFRVLAPSPLEVCLPGGRGAHAEVREQLLQVLALARGTQRRRFRVANKRLKILPAVQAFEFV